MTLTGSMNEGLLSLIENDLRYASATGRVRSLRKRLVDRNIIRRMLEAPDADSAFGMLGETSYAAFMAGRGIESYEDILQDGLADACGMVRSLSPEPSLVDVLVVRFDIHNIKVVIKSEKTGEDGAHLLSPLASLDTGLLRSAWRERDWRILPERWSRLLKEADLMLQNSGDIYLIDLMLDRAAFKEQLAWARRRSPYLLNWLTIRIDMLNISGLLRARAGGWPRERWRELYIRGGSIGRSRLESLYDLSPEQAAGSLAATTGYRAELERGLEVYRRHGSLAAWETSFGVRLVDALSAERYVTFGPQPLLAYILFKEVEVTAIRTIIIGKLNELPHEDIHERVQPLYFS